MSDERAILDALDLPAEALPLLFEHIADFCRAHGGAHHYADLLALAERYQLAQRAP
ncbi:MAG: hypothetical protein V4582_21295 [Pseudomonadota bacterium]